jgi:predicted RNA binding protein YcfA (HicA-like mRNA interferase family)
VALWGLGVLGGGGEIMTFREAEKMVTDDGWFLVKIQGSHHHYEHKTKPGKVTIPKHSGDIPQMVVNSIRKQAGLK